MDIERVEEAAPQVGIDSSSVGFFFRFLLVGLFWFVFFFVVAFPFWSSRRCLFALSLLPSRIGFVCLFVCLFFIFEFPFVCVVRSSISPRAVAAAAAHLAGHAWNIQVPSHGTETDFELNSIDIVRARVSSKCFSCYRSSVFVVLFSGTGGGTGGGV